jgi:hypothetical protein
MEKFVLRVVRKDLFRYSMSFGEQDEKQKFYHN